MSIYAVSDLHLPGGQEKPMDIFGDHWADHWGQISADWRAKVGPEDWVLIAGDISWAMALTDARDDLSRIHEMPGRKVIIRGNHDYWWDTISKVRRVLPPSITAVQNDHAIIGDMAVCGTRGWSVPGSRDFDEHDRKIYERECIRLQLSLKSAPDGMPVIAMIHYPPYNNPGDGSEMMEILGRYPVRDVIFGHLHGDSLRYVREGTYGGIQYHLTSCDYLGFGLKQIG